MATSRPRPEPAAGTSDLRQRIAAAARDLFASQGYERTTVDAIAERAGLSRRTFFRYFRSKDDAIFPDHDRIIQAIATHLAATSDQPPVQAVCGGVRLAFRSYVDDPVVSVQRYRVSRSVQALRDRETASVSQYTRLFSHYLAARFAAAEDPQQRAEATLRADVTAAAVVAAHNKVLRDWLRGGGEGDPMPAFNAALAWVARTFEPAGTGEQAGSGLVAVFRTGEPIGDVVERISRSL